MKRIICFITALLLLMPLFTFASPVASADIDRLYGDIDNDGKISVSDYVELRLHILGKNPLDDVSLIYADVSGDGKVNSQDYVAIRLHCLKIRLIEQPSNGDKPMIVAYIPLDDRPVNVDRVKYLASSAGITLLMPETSLFATRLDGQPQNSGGQLGDRKALLEWLKSVENDADAFVISLDQMLSGGLVGSRWFDNTDLSFEYGVADYIISLTKTKRVYLFDTVMRLASTSGFGGYGGGEYAMLREYAAVARKTLKGDKLTVDNIIAGYRNDENGRVIETPLTEKALTKYFASRSRKLKLADYILKNSGDYAFCYIGVDDSTPKTTIQTNEINYISSLLGENGRLFAGTDELGLMCFARLCGDVYGAPTVSTVYFGGGENEYADSFDIDNLGVCLKKHYDGLGLKTTNSGGDLTVLVLTRPYSGTIESNADRLVAEYNKCVKAKRPALIIDVSGQAYVLANRLIEKADDLGYLVSYSSWNTAANAIGIALSNGVSRISFLKSGREDTVVSREGFARSIVFSLCKDVGYKCEAKGAVDSCIMSLGGNVSNYYTQINEAGRKKINDTFREAMTDKNSFASRAVSALEKGRMMTSGLGLTVFPEITLTDFCLPWYRSFEASFAVKVG